MKILVVATMLVIVAGLSFGEGYRVGNDAGYWKGVEVTASVLDAESNLSITIANMEVSND